MPLPESLRDLADMLEDESMHRTKRATMCCSAMLGILAGLLVHPEVSKGLSGALIRGNDPQVIADLVKLHAFCDDIIKSRTS